MKDKISDSPVLVMEEEGKFIIPILSGHLGNANQIARMISKTTGAQAVITTATDVNEKFSIDNFAKANGFRIVNRHGIKKVSDTVYAETFFATTSFILKKMTDLRYNRGRKYASTGDALYGKLWLYRL